MIVSLSSAVKFYKVVPVVVWTVLIIVGLTCRLLNSVLVYLLNGFRMKAWQRPRLHLHIIIFTWNGSCLVTPNFLNTPIWFVSHTPLVVNYHIYLLSCNGGLSDSVTRPLPVKNRYLWCARNSINFWPGQYAGKKTYVHTFVIWWKTKTARDFAFYFGFHEDILTKNCLCLRGGICWATNFALIWHSANEDRKALRETRHRFCSNVISYLLFLD